MFGFCTRYGPKRATRMSRMTIMPPAMATLSCLSLVQAIRPGERPSMDFPPEAGTPGSGTAPPEPCGTSTGTAILKDSPDPRAAAETASRPSERQLAPGGLALERDSVNCRENASPQALSCLNRDGIRTRLSRRNY